MAKIYLAGPMQEWEPDGNKASRPIASWRQAIIDRARRNTYLCPEINEAPHMGHGEVDDHETALRDIFLIRECDALVAYIDSSERIGTFCEIAAAAALGKRSIMVCAPIGEWRGNLPWFVRRLGVLYRIPDDRTVSMEEIASACDSDRKREIYQEAIEKLVEVCGGDYLDYREYIQTREWKAKAMAAKERAGWRCQICNRHKDEVTLDAHHRTYERLGNELPMDITVLCRDDHEMYEKAKKNGRR
jgi:hypothetical protein